MRAVLLMLAMTTGGSGGDAKAVGRAGAGTGADDTPNH